MDPTLNQYDVRMGNLGFAPLHHTLATALKATNRGSVDVLSRACIFSRAHPSLTDIDSTSCGAYILADLAAIDNANEIGGYAP